MCRPARDIAGRLHACLGRAGDGREPRRRKRDSPARRCCASTASSAASRRRSRGATAAPTACSARIRAARRKFSEYDVSFLAAVANVIAGAIQRLQLDQRQELMIRELRHRSGNLFSQLLALFSQTAKNSKNRRRAGDEIRGARAGAGECAPPDHRGRLEIGLADGDAQYAAGALSRPHLASPGPMCSSSRTRPSG